MRCQCYDRDVRGPRIRAKTLRRFPSVQDGHAQIINDDLSQAHLCQIDRFGAVGRFDDVEPRNRQLLRIELPELLLIFGDEHDWALALRCDA